MKKELLGGQGSYNSWVESGKDKNEQLSRLSEVPDRFRRQVILHMRMVNKMKEVNNEN